MTSSMDPVSFLLGFTRLLTPPMAAPAPQSVVPKHAATNLGLDHDRLKAIYADQRVPATPPAKQPAPAPPPPGGGDAPASTAPAQQQAQQVQKIQETPAVEPTARVDAVERIAMADPLMATRMKEIYADRLTLSTPACRPDGWLAADAPLPWSL